MTTRYIAMAPVTELCDECGGAGRILSPGDSPEPECRTCRGAGRVDTGRKQPLRDARNRERLAFALPKQAVEANAAAVLDSQRNGFPIVGTPSVIAVNLEDAERVDPPESDDEREQRLDRILCKVAAELDELRRKRVHVEREPVAATLPVSEVLLRADNGVVEVSVRTGDEWQTIGSVDIVLANHGYVTSVSLPVAVAKRGAP